MQNILIKELMLNEFELGHNAVEATQNICAKDEGTIDHSAVTRWLIAQSAGAVEYTDWFSAEE